MLSWSVTAPAGTSRESACARRTTSPSFGYRPTRQNSIRWRTSGTISAATNSAGLSGTAMKPSSPPARTLGSSSSEIRSASIPSPVAPGHGSIFRAVGITAIARPAMPNDLSIQAVAQPNTGNSGAAPVKPAATAAPVEPTAPAATASPNPTLALNAALGLVVIEFRNNAGAVTSSIPTAQQIQA